MEGAGKFILLLSLFLSVHINFQCKLKYHTSSFIVTFYLFSSVALLIFSHLQFHCFFPIIFYYKCNMCEWFILLQVPSFVSNMACNGVLTPPAKVTPQIGNPLPVLKFFNPSSPVLKLFITLPWLEMAASAFFTHGYFQQEHVDISEAIITC